MRYFKIVMIIIVLFAFASCKRNRSYFDESRYKVKVDNVEPQLIELDESLKAPFYLKEIKRVETPLGGYTKWLKTPKYNELILIYLNGEKGGHGVLFYDKDLNLTKRKVIRSGEGPGEARGGFLLIGSETKLYMIDRGKKRLTVFDYNFSILKEKKYKMGPGFIHLSGVNLIKNDTEILHYFYVRKSSFCRGNINQMMSYAMRVLNTKDCSIKVLRSEDIINDTGRKMMSAYFAHWTVHDNHIYFVDLRDYIISKMDFNGKVIKKIKIKHEAKEFSQKERDNWFIENFGGSGNGGIYVKKISYPKKLYPVAFIFQIKKGFAIARREDYSPKELEYITADYFTWGMEFKGKIKVPLFEKWNVPGYCFKSEGAFYYKAPHFYTIKQEEESDFIIKWEFVDN